MTNYMATQEASSTKATKIYGVEALTLHPSKPVIVFRAYDSAASARPNLPNFVCIGADDWCQLENLDLSPDRRVFVWDSENQVDDEISEIMSLMDSKGAELMTAAEVL